MVRLSVRLELISNSTAGGTIHVTRQTLSNLFKGHTALSADMAIRFEKACGVKAGTSMRMQATNDGAGARGRERGGGGADEVERLFTEQQLRLSGEIKPEPSVQVHSDDRFHDGAIPRTEQLAKRESEIGPTCHVNGGWARGPTFSRYKAWTQDYEDQITRAPGLDYVVRNPFEKPVRFDGCAVWDSRRPLLEAKGPGHEALIEGPENRHS
ncbi:MAG: helix-turn-helix domain-containing protein [Phenylobacterium sp.]|nr:helix-turn-helix domain-containing protein [Phenylobacterium sp.]